MISTWIPGQEKTIDLTWTVMEFTVTLAEGKTASSIQFKIQNYGTSQGSLYVDECSLEAGSEFSDIERDITYVTQLDHTDDLPSSVQHHLLTTPYLHAPGPCRTITNTSAAGTAGEICLCSADGKFYGCTVTGAPGTWVLMCFTPQAPGTDINAVISALQAAGIFT